MTVAGGGGGSSSSAMGGAGPEPPDTCAYLRPSYPSSARLVVLTHTCTSAALTPVWGPRRYPLLPFPDPAPVLHTNG